MPTHSFELTNRFEKFLDDGVRSGRFQDAGEMVREGLRLLEQRERENEAKLEWLRAAVQEGVDDIERGDYVTLRSNQEIDDLIHDLRAERSVG